MINLDLQHERLFLLRNSNFGFGAQFVCDKTLSREIGLLLADFSRPFEPGETDRPGDRLLHLFGEYRMSVVKGMLQKLYLLQDAYQMEKKIAALLLSLRVHLEDQPSDRLKLLRELNAFASSPFDSVQEFLRVLVGRVCSAELEMQEALDSDMLGERTKQMVFSALIKKTKDPLILRQSFLKLVNQHDSPILREHLVKQLLTLNQPIDWIVEFLLQKKYVHGGQQIVGLLGYQFHIWVFKNARHFRPVLVRPLVTYVHLNNRSDKREEVIGYLLDQLCGVPDVLAETKRVLREILLNDHQKHYFDHLVSDRMLRKIKDVVAPRIDPAFYTAREPFGPVADILMLASQNDWKSLQKKPMAPKMFCEAFFLGDDKQRLFLLHYIEKLGFGKLPQFFWTNLQQDRRFPALSIGWQLTLVKKLQFEHFINVSTLNHLSQTCHESIRPVLGELIAEKLKSGNNEI